MRVDIHPVHSINLMEKVIFFWNTRKKTYGFLSKPHTTTLIMDTTITVIIQNHQDNDRLFKKQVGRQNSYVFYPLTGKSDFFESFNHTASLSELTALAI